MMKSIIDQYQDKLESKYADKLLPSHFKTLNAITNCRTSEAGQLYVYCPECSHTELKPLSCGNRNCPICQNHETSQWIDRQIKKLLPVLYFMVTFTLPYELRSLTWHHQRKVYTIFFASVSSTLKDFGLNDKHLGVQIGMTMVLHTNNRKQDFHPHTHVIVPGGGIDDKLVKNQKLYF